MDVEKRELKHLLEQREEELKMTKMSGEVRPGVRLFIAFLTCNADVEA